MKCDDQTQVHGSTYNDRTKINSFEVEELDDMVLRGDLEMEKLILGDCELLE